MTSLTCCAAQSGEESVLVASLRDVIAKQAAEIEALQNKLQALTASTSEADRTAKAITEVWSLCLPILDPSDRPID